MKTLLSLLAVPLFAQQEVNFYSIEKERALGQQLATELRRRSTPVEDASINAYVQRMGRHLAAQVQRSPFEFQFEVVATSGDSIEPNAAPGGYIFIPVRSLVEVQEEAEFVVLLAHAISHAALRHGTRSATRGQVVNLASIPLIFMGPGMGTHADSRQVLVPLGALKFQRILELQADTYGLDLAARSGYDASAFKRYVERTQRPDALNSPLPAREVRLAEIEKALSSLRSINPTASSDEFRRVQEAARSLIGVPERKEPPTLRRP